MADELEELMREFEATVTPRTGSALMGPEAASAGGGAMLQMGPPSWSPSYSSLPVPAEKPEIRPEFDPERLRADPRIREILEAMYPPTEATGTGGAADRVVLETAAAVYDFTGRPFAQILDWLGKSTGWRNETISTIAGDARRAIPAPETKTEAYARGAAHIAGTVAGVVTPGGAGRVGAHLGARTATKIAGKLPAWLRYLVGFGGGVAGFTAAIEVPEALAGDSDGERVAEALIAAGESPVRFPVGVVQNTRRAFADIQKAETPAQTQAAVEEFTDLAMLLALGVISTRSARSQQLRKARRQARLVSEHLLALEAGRRTLPTEGKGPERPLEVPAPPEEGPDIAVRAADFALIRPEAARRLLAADDAARTKRAGRVAPAEAFVREGIKLPNVAARKRFMAALRRAVTERPAAEPMEGQITGTRRFSSDPFVEERLVELDKEIPPGDTKRRAAFDLLVSEIQAPERGLPIPDIAQLAREGDPTARLALQMAKHRQLLFVQREPGPPGVSLPAARVRRFRPGDRVRWSSPDGRMPQDQGTVEARPARRADHLLIRRDVGGLEELPVRILEPATAEEAPPGPEIGPRRRPETPRDDLLAMLPDWLRGDRREAWLQGKIDDEAAARDSIAEEAPRVPPDPIALETRRQQLADARAFAEEAAREQALERAETVLDPENLAEAADEQTRREVEVLTPQRTEAERARLEADRAEVAEGLKRAMSGLPPPTQRGGRERRAAAPAPQPPPHPNAQVERALRRAHGVPLETWGQRLRALWREAVHAIGRPQLNIPKNDPFFATANEVFRESKQIDRVAPDEAVRDVSAILSPLSGNQRLLFERKILAENQIASYEQRGEPLRFNSQEVQEWKDYAAQLDELIERQPEVQEALNTRKRIVRELVEKLVEADILSLDALDNWETYYHQQVLAYAQLNRWNRLLRGGRLLQGRKSFQRRRLKGEALDTQYDYNTDYIQAELRWMTDAHAKLMDARLLRTLFDRYDKLPSLIREARKLNFERLVGGPENVRLIEELRAEAAGIRAAAAEGEPLDKGKRARLKEISEQLWALDPTMPARRKIAIGMRMLEMDENLDLDMRTISRLAQTAESEKIQIGARTVLKGIAERERIYRETLGDELISWEELVPEGYAPLRPRPGHALYRAFTIPDRIMEMAERENLEQLRINVKEVKQALVLGARRTLAVLPEEIVAELERWKKPRPSGAIANANRALMRGWKAFRLIAPMSVLGYNLRNLSGDLDPVIGGASGALKYMPWAAGRLYGFYMKGELSMPPIVKQARDLGVIDSSMLPQELPDVQFNRVLERFYDKPLTPATVMTAPARAYWRQARQWTIYRENIARLAAFRYYLEHLRRGDLTNYGASKRSVIEALKKEMGTEVAAAKLARDLIGDYGDIHVFGQWLRERALPFWSFQEINLKRYPRMFINAAQAGQIRSMAAAPAMLLYRGLLTSRLFTLYAGSWLANNFLTPDKEADLGRWDKQNPHLNLCRTPDGSVRVFRQFGALGEFFEWAGINTLLGLWDQYEDGVLTGKDLAAEVTKDPVNKLVQMWHPFLKTIGESLLGQSMFPDVFNPRTQDRSEIVTNMVGLRDEWRAVKGAVLRDGTRMRPHRLERILAGIVDPRRQALLEMYDLRSRFLRREGRPDPNFHGVSLWRNLREAAMAEDYEAFKEARLAYLRDGGNYDKFLASLSKLDPIADRLSDEDETKFDAFLPDRDRHRFNVARRYAAELKVTLWHWWNRAAAEQDAPEKQRRLEDRIRVQVGRALEVITSPPLGETASAEAREKRAKELARAREMIQRAVPDSSLDGLVDLYNDYLTHRWEQRRRNALNKGRKVPGKPRFESTVPPFGQRYIGRRKYEATPYGERIARLKAWYEETHP